MALSDQKQLINLPISPTAIKLWWACALLLLFLVFRASIDEMVTVWFTVEEYSHGFFIPCITAYLIWIRRAELNLASNVKNSMLGLMMLALGLFLFVLGELSALRTLEQYAFLIALIGLFGTAFGLQSLRIFAIPLLYLIFMVPFPSFIISNLSSKLQLISSWLGVEFIRACDIMVFLEGNVIDLGAYKLQVVDACSGLRYLFPLSSLAFLCAYLFKGSIWQKISIFLSSVPLTVFMNSFRIGVIGVLVDHWGTDMAEGFMHDFEGWLVFLLCMLLLFVEMWVFSRISGRKLAMIDLVQIPVEWGAAVRKKSTAPVLNKSVFIVFILLSVGIGASETFKSRVDIIPQRKAFLTFPTQIGAWHGRNDYLTQNYLDELKLTDYVIVNFTSPETQGYVNFYSAYYQSQRKGVVVHSPRSCLPGDGWQISQIEQLDFPELKLDGQGLHLNRAIIAKGENKQLVYFWFQQRGRDIANEYMVKWYIFFDSITMNRTDGALIRLMTSVDNAEDISAADQRLQAFLKDLLVVMPPYFPGNSIVQAGHT